MGLSEDAGGGGGKEAEGVGGEIITTGPHLEVPGLQIGIMQPGPLFQQAAAQVLWVQVEVPTQENHISLLGCVAGGIKMVRQEFFPHQFCPKSGTLQPPLSPSIPPYFPC